MLMSKTKFNKYSVRFELYLEPDKSIFPTICPLLSLFLWSQPMSKITLMPKMTLLSKLAKTGPNLIMNRTRSHLASSKVLLGLLTVNKLKI